jgi:hypothetical protein
MDADCMDWLMGGDPSIRWQVLRDLLGESSQVVERERARLFETGWVADLLSRQDADGKWGAGIYSPKWTGTTYTLLLLRQLGLPAGNLQALRGCDHLYSVGFARDGGLYPIGSTQTSETCINGMFLTLLAYFRHPDDRIHGLANHLLGVQMADGGWNCRQFRDGSRHASFNTTILVLEGLGEYCRTYADMHQKIQPALDAAHEFLLQHHLYQSHHTGEPANPVFMRMCFPPRWHYDFLRGLDYFQSISASRDERMQDAIQLLTNKRGEDGRWVLNTPWSGKVYFNLESAGKPSRWNTLRALRTLKWWEAQ